MSQEELNGEQVTNENYQDPLAAQNGEAPAKKKSGVPQSQRSSCGDCLV